MRFLPTPSSRQRRLNVAITALSAFIVTVHVVPVPLQSPLQPSKTVLPMTRAVNVTTVPLVNTVLHAVPQSMPDGLLVTLPFELFAPFRITVNVNVVVVPPLIVNGNAFEATAPGFTTVTWAVPAVAMSVAGIAAVT